MADPRPLATLILAAGKGTRMKSRIPKVLHEVCGRPMLGHLLEAAAAAEPSRSLVVVGHAEEVLRAAGYGADEIQGLRERKVV